MDGNQTYFGIGRTNTYPSFLNKITFPKGIKKLDLAIGINDVSHLFVYMFGLEPRGISFSKESN